MHRRLWTRPHGSAAHMSWGSWEVKTQGERKNERSLGIFFGGFGLKMLARWISLTGNTRERKLSLHFFLTKTLPSCCVNVREQADKNKDGLRTWPSGKRRAKHQVVTQFSSFCPSGHKFVRHICRVYRSQPDVRKLLSRTPAGRHEILFEKRICYSVDGANFIITNITTCIVLLSMIYFVL